MPNTTTIEPLALTINQASQLTGLSRSTIYDFLSRGAFTARKADGRTLIERQSIEAWFAALPAYRPAPGSRPKAAKAA